MRYACAFGYHTAIFVDHVVTMNNFYFACKDWLAVISQQMQLARLCDFLARLIK